MPIPKEEIERQHSVTITEITDRTSRFSFKLTCSCGVQGHFYTQEQVDKYKYMHLSRQGLVQSA
jgi:hypothetical protein